MTVHLHVNVLICLKITTANTCEVSQSKRPRLLSHLALPYNRLTRIPSPRLLKKIRQVFPKINGVESELSSDLSSDMTSDPTDVSCDLTDISSVPPSPGVLKNIEQGALRAVAGGDEKHKHFLVLFPFVTSNFFLISFSCLQCCF